MLSLIQFFLLFLLAFVIAPFGITQFENPKVIFAEAGIIILFLATLFRNPNIFHNKIHKFTLLYTVVIILTIIDLIFFKTTVSFFGNAFRMQGIFLLWLLFLFSYLCGYIKLKKIPWTVILFLLIVSALTTFFLSVNESGRYVGAMGEPNATAAFMLFLWPFLWFALDKDKQWKMVIIGIGLSLVLFVFYLTGSRSALIGFFLQIFFLTLQHYKVSMKKALIVCLCLLFASFALPFFQKDVLYEDRGEVWAAGVSAGLSNPLVGGGFGNTELLLHKAAEDKSLSIRFSYADSSHNIFLDWWAQGGIIGLAIFCIFIAGTFRNFVLKNEKRGIVLLLGILTALSFNPASVVSLLHLWWLIGTSQLKD